MNPLSLTTEFSNYGAYLMLALLVFAGLGAILGGINLCRQKPFIEKQEKVILICLNVLFGLGFIAICWLHYTIYLQLPLEIPSHLVSWINSQLGAMNAKSAYSIALYNPAHPPRYLIPLWIDNEKYYFWFMCYAGMALLAWRYEVGHRLRGMLLIFLALQVSILYFVTNPFADPLARFFSEITPWFSGHLSAQAQFGLFMTLYPKMIYYYNASYMWLHPPMLFLSYACITITFIASAFMLVKRELSIEILGYDFAKFGYFMLTLGMLLGYPWALKAWGPNWWWDPKICSSIMMWAIYSTYLHTRLYANKPAMWYFTSFLGLLCFVAMIFTFITSFYFPGEHTFQ